MIGSFTYKQRFYIYVFFVFVSSIVCYFVSIKRTVQIVVECNNMKNEIVNYESNIEKILLVKKDVSSLESKMRKFNTNGDGVQDKIVKNIAFFCEQHGILIKGVAFPNSERGRVKMLETMVITVKGNYFGILQLAFNIEQKFGIGRISSLHLFMQQNTQNNVKELFACIYLQNILS